MNNIQEQPNGDIVSKLVKESVAMNLMDQAGKRLNVTGFQKWLVSLCLLIASIARADKKLLQEIGKKELYV